MKTEENIIIIGTCDFCENPIYEYDEVRTEPEGVFVHEACYEEDVEYRKNGGE